MGEPAQRPVSHAAEAYRAIKRLVLDGRLLPGKRVSHRSLAMNVGLGRGAVRDAILQLEAQGLLEQLHKSGVRLRQFSAEEIADVCRLRVLVEPLFAEQAAIRSDVRQIDEMERLCDQFDTVLARAGRQVASVADQQWRALVSLDMRFHAAVIDAAGDWLLGRFYRHDHMLALHGVWHLQREGVSLAGEDVTALEHRAIVAAIRARDPVAAAAASRRHHKNVSLDVLPG